MCFGNALALLVCFLLTNFFLFSFPFACARNGGTLRNDPARCVCCQDVCVCATPPSHHRRPRCQRLSGGDGGKHTSPRFKSLVSVGENERGDAGEGEREKNEEELQQGSHAKAAAAPPGDDEREAHFRTQSRRSSQLLRLIKAHPAASHFRALATDPLLICGGGGEVLKLHETIHPHLPAAPNAFVSSPQNIS